MRKLVEESNNKKKAKKKMKEKQKKQIPNSGIPKANAVAGYGAKANNIGENLGKLYKNNLDYNFFEFIFYTFYLFAIGIKFRLLFLFF